MKGKISTRDVYGDTLKEIGADERVVVLDAEHLYYVMYVWGSLPGTVF